MNAKKIVALIAFAALMLGGCASKPEERTALCLTVGGAFGGGTAGAAISGPAAPAGVVAGAIAGILICSPDDDQDQDGVADGMDQCPSTPAGAEVHANGCELDSDGDGVANSADQCPNTPAGIEIDAQGCEVVVEKAAPAPAAVSAATISEQCLPYLTVTDGKLMKAEPVLFAFNSAEITDEGRMILSCVAEAAKVTGVSMLEVAGYTDSVGSQAYNKRLSQRRASNARAILVSEGISEGQLDVQGYGMDDPAVSNDSESNRALNRRVQVLPKQ